MFLREMKTGMIDGGAYKAFDRSLYIKADTKGKDVISNLLIKKGHTLTNIKETYSCDIVTEKNGVTHNSEVEIKFSWKEEWPLSWEEIRIPYRKHKLLGKPNLTFYVLRSDCKQAWEIDADILANVATIKEVPNRYIRKGEKFFHVPVQHAKLLEV